MLPEDEPAPGRDHSALGAGLPSRTALGAARHRAAHQLLEAGWLFSDPLAVRILGDDGEAALREAPMEGFGRALRLFIAARSRLAEDALADAVTQGVRQLVILGAGLDTYAYRSPFAARLRIFEVDHPATQAWKRDRLIAAAIRAPAALTFAPVDFERQTLAEGLAAAGFDASQATFFTWLGVVPYLTEAAVFATLAYIADLPGGADVVFDYANPTAAVTGAARAGHAALAARVAAAGENFRSYFDTDALCSRLAALGFRTVQDLGPPQIAARFFPSRVGVMPDRGGHIVRAATR
jgi:methyltransferase (TIGR00027 family)